MLQGRLGAPQSEGATAWTGQKEVVAVSRSVLFLLISLPSPLSPRSSSPALSNPGQYTCCCRAVDTGKPGQQGGDGEGLSPTTPV